MQKKRANAGLSMEDWAQLVAARAELCEKAALRHAVPARSILQGRKQRKTRALARAREDVISGLRKFRMSTGRPRRILDHGGGVSLSTPVIGQLLGLNHSTVVLALQRIALRQESAVQSIFEGSQGTDGQGCDGTETQEPERPAADRAGAASHAGAAAGISTASGPEHCSQSSGTHRPADGNARDGAGAVGAGAAT